MLYCEKCKLLYTNPYCPVCNCKTGRNPELEDLCFLTEQPQLWGDMLKDVLRQNDIPTFTQNVLGAGMAMKAGALSERIKFYVPFSHYEKASQIVEEILSSTDSQEL